MKILLTGAAGFIGMHVCQEIFNMYPHAKVFGLDNLNTYYSPKLKRARLKELSKNKKFIFIKADITNAKALDALCKKERFDYIVHLAAQAGVSYSLVNPKAYVDSNITGFLNILEVCKNYGVKHLVYASSSSVYGLNTKMPFAETDTVDKPASFYAVTKKANEAMAFAYADLYNIKSTGIRFFTVYGPWYRPDMALSIFARQILAGEKISLFNRGRMKRDFTYIDDAAHAVARLLKRVPKKSEIFNIGNNCPSDLKEVVAVLERALGQKARVEYLPMRAGDVPATYADIKKINKAIGFKPKTDICRGIEKFAAWHKEYYKL